jgi:glycosyltransferase involved in cell wall biosynthesis
MKDLTICIPTFERDPFLAWTLNKTREGFGPEQKIIISDNGKSTLRPEGVRYLRQPQNIGAFPNMRTALLAASTKYCVFLGDDDYLLPDQVQKGIDYLEANPSVGIYYAPCQLYDEVNQQANWEAFYPAADETFSTADGLWNFIIGKHVWPEHAIYRREGLADILQPRTAAYWCFTDLAHAACRFPVHFAKTPYYRNITNHPVGGRMKLGDMQCLTDFDNYRWGLEYLAHDIFNQPLALCKPEEVMKLKSDISNMIRQFIWSRYEVAVRIHKANGRLGDANLLEKRLAMTGY